MSEIVKLPHLPPMTEGEFAAYMAAQQETVRATQALYATVHQAGRAAYTRGVEYDDCPSDNTDAAFVRAWRQGWSDAEQESVT